MSPNFLSGYHLSHLEMCDCGARPTTKVRHPSAHRDSFLAVCRVRFVEVMALDWIAIEPYLAWVLVVRRHSWPPRAVVRSVLSCSSSGCGRCLGLLRWAEHA